jgi:RNA polymerase sigma-70 factor (ECF subfamily)
MQASEQKAIFEDWLSRHRGLLFKVVRAYATTPPDQDDLFQEIALQVWKSIPNFQRRSAESTWLYRVALQTALAWTRRERKHRTGQRDLGPVEHVLQAPSEPVDPRLDWLYAEINRMEAVDRSLCLLQLDGFSYREMAELLGISASNVGVKVHRIKQQLITRAQKMEPHGI